MTREYVCHPELHTLALHTLTKVTLMGMFCTAQEHMHKTHMHKIVGHNRLQRPEEAVNHVVDGCVQVMALCQPTQELLYVSAYSSGLLLSL